MPANVIPMFDFNGLQMRCVWIDGEPQFVLNDVLRILGTNLNAKGQPNVTVAVRGLDEDEHGLYEIQTPTPAIPHHVTRMRCVSRPGLFKLIQRSSKPEAKAFDRWVRHVVLPQIMDNGGYMARDADIAAVVAAAPANPARTDLDLLKQMMCAIQAAQDRIMELSAEVEAAAPKVEAFDELMDADGTLNLQQASRALGLKANALAATLRAQKVLRHVRGANVAYAQYHDSGYFVTKTVVGHGGYAGAQTRVTPRGLEWLRRRLKAAA